MVGQDPFVPGENDRLPWIAAATLSDGELGEAATDPNKPTLYYLYSSGDSSHCCAMAIERGFFKTQKFVRLGTGFNCFKHTRESSEGRELIDQFRLNDRPAILLLDREGVELGRLDDHIDDPKKFGALLETALALNAHRLKTSAKVSDDIERAAHHLERGNVRMALRLFQNGEKKAKYLLPSIEAKLTEAFDALKADGLKRVEDALAVAEADPAVAHEQLFAVREGWRGLDASDQAADAMRRLESDPTAGPVIEEARKQKRRGR